MNTMTLDAKPATRRQGPALNDIAAALLRRLDALFAPRTAEAVAELHRLADAYQSTQPSYAADLRAAADAMR